MERKKKKERKGKGRKEKEKEEEGGKIEKERQRNRLPERNRQTNRQTDRLTDRLTDRPTDQPTDLVVVLIQPHYWSFAQHSKQTTVCRSQRQDLPLIDTPGRRGTQLSDTKESSETQYLPTAVEKHP